MMYCRCFEFQARIRWCLLFEVIILLLLSWFFRALWWRPMCGEKKSRSTSLRWAFIDFSWCARTHTRVYRTWNKSLYVNYSWFFFSQSLSHLSVALRNLSIATTTYIDMQPYLWLTWTRTFVDADSSKTRVVFLLTIKKPITEKQKNILFWKNHFYIYQKK